jgi:hypothetical protein
MFPESLDPHPRDFSKKHQVPPPLDFQPAWIYGYSKPVPKAAITEALWTKFVTGQRLKFNAGIKVQKLGQ